MARDQQTDSGRFGPSVGSRESFMLDMPWLMSETTTEDENDAGGWNGVNAPVGGKPPSTRTVGSRGEDPDTD